MEKILIICKDAPISDNGSAGGIRLFRMLEILSEVYELYVICNSADFGIQHLKKIGCKYIVVNQSFNKEIEKLKEEDFKIVMISFWYLAEIALPIVRQYFHNAKVIIDTVDIHFIRDGSVREREVAIYRQADFCITISTYDNTTFKNAVPEIASGIIPLIFDVGFLSDYQPRNKNLIIKRSMYFIGNFLHQPNVDSVEYILNNIFPEIKKIYDDATIYIIGKHASLNLKRLHNPDKGINFTGVKYELNKFLQTMEVAIMPIIIGSGQNGKIAEAMINKIPIITNNIGIRGMGINKFLMVGNTVEEVVKCYDQLMKMSEEQIKWLTYKGLIEAHKLFDKQVIKYRLLRLFAKL